MIGADEPFRVLASGAFGYMFDYIVWWLLLLSLLIHTWCFFRFFPRDRLRKIGLVLGNALVFLCMSGILAMAAESYLRFVAVHTDAFGMSLPAQRWFALHTRLNSLGCRDEEWSIDKPPGIRRIAFVGDSFLYGWGIERVADRFTDRLQGMFDKHGPGRVQIMNVAKPGWGTGDQIQPIRDMIDVYGADEIVLCYVPNDIEKLIQRTEDFDPTKPPDYSFFNPDSSPLLDYLYRRLYLPFKPTVRHYHDWLADGFADPDIFRQHMDQFQQIIEDCRNRNVTFRVVLFPFLVTSGEKLQSEQLHGTLRLLLEQADVEVIDLWAVLVRGRGLDLHDYVVNSLDAHPNEAAHAIFAEVIAAGFYPEIASSDTQ
jgi:hypothetical protein